MRHISVLGGGTWACAIARLLAMQGHDVTLWSAVPAEIQSLAQTRSLPHLPDLRLPESVTLTGDLETAVRGKDSIYFAVASKFVRQTAERIRPYLPKGQLLVSVAKGMESGTLYTLSEVICDVLSDLSPRVVALSGPTHAEEVVQDLPTAIVAASPDMDAARQVQDDMMSPSFRVYVHPDIRGAELCGALKNIIALAAGISDGLGYGDNTKAAIITRGMAEITRLGTAMGCAPDTFSGLAGIGDLVVTCTSVHSRNHRAGVAIGQGIPPAQAVSSIGMVVEGVYAIPASLALASRYGVELPIISAVAAVLDGRLTPVDAVSLLMGREKKAEHTTFPQ